MDVFGKRQSLLGDWKIPAFTGFQALPRSSFLVLHAAELCAALGFSRATEAGCSLWCSLRHPIPVPKGPEGHLRPLEPCHLPTSPQGLQRSRNLGLGPGVGPSPDYWLASRPPAWPTCPLTSPLAISQSSRYPHQLWNPSCCLPASPRGLRRLVTAFRAIPATHPPVFESSKGQSQPLEPPPLPAHQSLPLSGCSLQRNPTAASPPLPPLLDTH